MRDLSHLGRIGQQLTQTMTGNTNDPEGQDVGVQCLEGILAVEKVRTAVWAAEDKDSDAPKITEGCVLASERDVRDSGGLEADGDGPAPTQARAATPHEPDVADAVPARVLLLAPHLRHPHRLVSQPVRLPTFPHSLTR